ncbi:MAG: hypothetical protein PHQ32_03685 [Firmicutes bacterium]|nr:hypothetical protein [Bacillota bacterium]
MVKRQYLNNVKQLLVPFLIVVILGTILLSYSSYAMGVSSVINAPVEAWIYGCEPVDLFFPLLASLPFSWVLFTERKNGFLNYVAIRTNKTKYIRNKMLSGMLLSFTAIFTMYFLSLIYVLFFTHFKMDPGASRLVSYMFGNYQLNNPLIFGLVWASWKGVISALICLFGQVFSLYNKNIFVISTAPFIYVFLENFITASLSIPEFSLTTSFVLNRLTPEVIQLQNLFIGFFTLILVIFITNIYYKWRSSNALANQE